MAVSGTVFDMINAVHHEKPLIFIGALDNATRVYRSKGFYPETHAALKYIVNYY